MYDDPERPPPGFEWDPRKAARKLGEGVSFHDAVGVFDDLDSVEFIDDREDYGEERWAIIGRVRNGRLMTVIYTDRGDRVRIITAWWSTPAERRKYREQDGS